jgi:hypothetical protein
MDIGGMLRRMVRAAMLDSALYEAVEKDKTLDREARNVVILVALADGIGLALAQALSAEGLKPGRALLWLLFGVIAGVFVYYLWSYVTFRVGRALYRGGSDIGQVRRTIGYAQAPRALALLWFVPTIGPALGALGWLWALVAGIVAVRQALDFTTGRAIVTVIVGWLVAFVIFWLVAFLVGIPFLMFASLA